MTGWDEHDRLMTMSAHYNRLAADHAAKAVELVEQAIAVRPATIGAPATVGDIVDLRRLDHLVEHAEGHLRGGSDDD